MLGRHKSWSDAPPSLSSGLHQISSERSSWRDSVCRCLFVKSGASLDCWLTVTDGTEQHAHSGRLHTRASAPERTLARVCREAGASVRFSSDSDRIASVVNSIVCMAARADKERKCSELLYGDRCRLVVVALSTLSNGWRWPAPATHHPICNGQLFCPGGAVGLA